MLKTEPDSLLLELALRQLPISLGDQTSLDLFLRLLGQLAGLVDRGLYTREAVKTHLHRRPKVQAAINARVEEAMTALELDARSGVALFHCLAILGMDSEKTRDLLVRIEDQVMTYPAVTEEEGEQGVQEILEGGEVEGGEASWEAGKVVRVLGGGSASAPRAPPQPCRDLSLIPDEDPSWCDFAGPHQLGFDDWAFLAWGLCESNWRPEWAEKILLQLAEERWGGGEPPSSHPSGQETTRQSQSPGAMSSPRPDSPVRSPQPASQEALVKLGWSFAVRNLPCPVALLEELAEQDQLPKDDLLRFAQPLAHDVLKTRRAAYRSTGGSCSEGYYKNLTEKAKIWLKDTKDCLRSDVHLPVRAPLKERRRTPLRPKEYPHDTWLADVLASMQLSHNRNYVISNLYRAPIAFPKKRFLIGERFRIRFSLIFMFRPTSRSQCR